MSEPLKGGLSSFASLNGFNPGGASAAPSAGTFFGGGVSSSTPGPPSGGLFGNTGTATPASAAGSTGLFGGNTSAAQAQSTGAGTGSLGGGGLFGKPAGGGGLFGNTNSATSTAAPSGSLFGGKSLFGSGNTTSTAPAPGNNAAASGALAAPSSGLGLFGMKPADQALSNAPASTSTNQPSSVFGSLGGGASTGAGSSQPAAAPSLPSLFGGAKPADSASAATSPAPSGGLFGSLKPASTPAAGTTPTTAAPTSLFGNFGSSAKKDEGASKVTTSTGLFGQTTSKDGSSSTTLPPSSLPLFGTKPSTDSTKDNAKESEKKPDSSIPTGSSIAPATTTSASICVPAPSMLRGKTIEEIVNKWSSDLETNVKDFTNLAGEIGVWDRALIDNGNTIAALFQHVLVAEREQNDLEQSLKHVEEQQKELASTLDVYEKHAGEIFDNQSGGLRALDVGPADAERDKQYSLAADLNSHLDDLSRSLMQMIDSVNTISAEGKDGSTKKDAPLEQIAQILSSHLESLQWIDGAVREVDGKVTDVERRIRDASSSSTSSNSVSGYSSSQTYRPRGFR